MLHLSSGKCIPILVCLTDRKLSSTGRDPAEYNFYHIWVRRAIHSRHGDNIDPTSFNAETVLDLASESNNPSRSRSPYEGQTIAPSEVLGVPSAGLDITRSQDPLGDLIPPIGHDHDLPNVPDAINADRVDWPPTLGDLSVPLFQHNADVHSIAQTLELDPLSGLFPFSWIDRESEATGTDAVEYDANLWD